MRITKLLLGIVLLFALLLRTYQLTSVPISLSWDEASLGYNAFAIGESLKDEHGELLPVARFIAFGDYKPPGYIYMAVPFVKLMGLSELSTRLPSALAGTLLVLITFAIVKELFKSDKAALVASFLLAISPWALQFSRGAFEGNMATMFSGAAIYFFLRGTRIRAIVPLLVSAVSFVLAMYTFNSHRIFVPLMLGSLLLIYWRGVWQRKVSYLVMLILFGVLLLPMVPHVLSPEGKLRFQEVSWMADVEPIEQANERVALDNSSLESRILHNRRHVYGYQFLLHYFDTFNPKFLFASGDVNPRLSSQTVGELYLIELPFLLLGIIFLLRFHRKAGLLLLLWLLVAPVPGAFARETPHALRMLNLLPVPQIVIALGIVSLLRHKWKKLVVLAISFAFALSFLFYINDYYRYYPQTSALEWQYGHAELVSKVKAIESNYDAISVTETYGRPYIYFLFHEDYPVSKYLETRKVDRDAFGFWYVRGFGPYLFYGAEPESGKILYVRGPEETVANTKVVDSVKTQSGKVVFNLLEKI